MEVKRKILVDDPGAAPGPQFRLQPQLIGMLGFGGFGAGMQQVLARVAHDGSTTQVDGKRDISPEQDDQALQSLLPARIPPMQTNVPLPPSYWAKQRALSRTTDPIAPQEVDNDAARFLCSRPSSQHTPVSYDGSPIGVQQDRQRQEQLRGHFYADSSSLSRPLVQAPPRPSYWATKPMDRSVECSSRQFQPGRNRQPVAEQRSPRPLAASAPAPPASAPETPSYRSIWLHPDPSNCPSRLRSNAADCVMLQPEAQAVVHAGTQGVLPGHCSPKYQWLHSRE
eukprot:NODE_2828_length_1112_cov_29.014111_g2592_i0.p1 GENE.NODE_2828_length_1112_cov_29.014111_g2592_i0~~NODE_2828_length_1112_cov_29.014111_g2592_i0.p1  ORF type:complete len:282 (+),score=30.44 NODE_2828_length_1112_cov_29.014111_g2592_i0:99-944(+)